MSLFSILSSSSDLRPADTRGCVEANSQSSRSKCAIIHIHKWHILHINMTQINFNNLKKTSTFFKWCSSIFINCTGNTKEVSLQCQQVCSSEFPDRVWRPVISSSQSSFCPTGAFDFHSRVCQSESCSGPPTAAPPLARLRAQRVEKSSARAACCWLETFLHLPAPSSGSFCEINRQVWGITDCITLHPVQRDG